MQITKGGVTNPHQNMQNDIRIQYVAPEDVLKRNFRMDNHVERRT